MIGRAASGGKMCVGNFGVILPHSKKIELSQLNPIFEQTFFLGLSANRVAPARSDFNEK